VNIRGKARDTTLGDASIGLVTVGQAIHWFDREPATREFTRILRKNGQLGVVYNDRNKKDPFMQSYEAIIEKHARDRAMVPDVLALWPLPGRSPLKILPERKLEEIRPDERAVSRPRRSTRQNHLRIVHAKCRRRREIHRVDTRCNKAIRRLREKGQGTPAL